MNSSGVRRWSSGVNEATSVSATPAAASSSSRRSRVVRMSTRFPIASLGCGSKVITVGSSPESIPDRSTDRCPRWTPSNVPIATARGRRSSWEGACAILMRLAPPRAGAVPPREAPHALRRPPRPRTARSRSVAGRRSDLRARRRCERTYVPEPTRRSSAAIPSTYETSSSSWTRITRVGISTATPFRCSRYARSPSIFTADAAGIGSSTAPRRPSRALASAASSGDSWVSTTSPSGSPVAVRDERSISVR